jgi:hypothetical protein
MTQREPSAAAALYPHLPTSERPERTQRTPNISDAMWPKLSREAKAQEADQRRWDELCKRNRDHLLRGLKELNRKFDARYGRR